MTRKQPQTDLRIDTVECPVFGGQVTVQASYGGRREGCHYLIDFTCSGEGMCGVPAWDPCPLYVCYLEGRA